MTRLHRVPLTHLVILLGQKKTLEFFVLLHTCKIPKYVGVGIDNNNFWMHIFPILTCIAKHDFFFTAGICVIYHCWTSQSSFWTIMTWWTHSTTLDIQFPIGNARTWILRSCSTNFEGESCKFILKVIAIALGWEKPIFTEWFEWLSTLDSTWSHFLAKPNSCSPTYYGTLIKKSLETKSFLHSC